MKLSAQASKRRFTSHEKLCLPLVLHLSSLLRSFPDSFATLLFEACIQTKSSLNQKLYLLRYTTTKQKNVFFLQNVTFEVDLHNTKVLAHSLIWYYQKNILWLLFPQNWCFCSSEAFTKCIGLVVEICYQRLFGVSMHFDETFNEKAFVARNRAAVRIVIQFVVGLFINGSGKS